MSHVLLLCSDGFFTVHSNALLRYTAHHHPLSDILSCFPASCTSYTVIRHFYPTSVTTAFWHSPPSHNYIINQHKTPLGAVTCGSGPSFPCQFSAPQPIFTPRLIDKENARRGRVIHRGQVKGLFLCWRYKVGDLMTRGDLVGEMPPLCCLVCANVAVAQCGAPLISQTYISPIDWQDTICGRSEQEALWPNIIVASSGFKYIQNTWSDWYSKAIYLTTLR